jgi:endonuclease/exonuclease/phosphatase family metal-dependent hydrolase
MRTAWATSCSSIVLALFAAAVLARAPDIPPATPDRPCLENAAGPNDAPLRAMSFNVRVNVASDGADAWPQRKEKVASMIRFHRADLVGLQEPLPEQVADLQRLLPELGWFGVGRHADGGGELSAIFFRTDRLEVLDQGTFWLSSTPDAAGSRGWDAALPRIVTWGRLRDRHTGAVFHHFNTHFDHLGRAARRESALLLATKIKAIAGDTPVVVTGDFNSTADDDPFRILTRTTPPTLVDAMTASREPHHGPTSTWNGFKAIEPGRRIDFVFVNPRFEVRAHAMLSDTFDGRFPSDHLPVLAEIAVRQPPPLRGE